MNFSFSDDNFLLSSENLRSSPELWPEKIPGSDNFAKSAHKNARENENGLTQEDIRLIYRKLCVCALGDGMAAVLPVST